ncbi:hypothetical protein [Candidatus Nitrospira inopinata]|jgi:hypothetical protein|uniref:Uncharacterized protein n=1 Tax=Candidatus Nitrospira inopinata TaxID=1715989 RepID=A0A0S4KX90_9BACT|nr:hypothetical protein [Candidatus Nitrospira inopinata]CUQ67806.1 protein of unknown function [Candidatus Nitrospira inopinata]
MKILRACWQWFQRQTWLNKIIILGLFAVVVPFFLPTIVAWFKPTMINVGVAFYTYERGRVSEGKTAAYFFEKRNLVTNCSLRRVEQTIPPGEVRLPRQESWVIIKLLLENVSDESITRLRLAVRSPAIGPATQVSTAPMMEATGQMETPPNDGRRWFVVTLPAIAPRSSVVLSLKTPLDDNLRKFIYEDRRTVTIQVPFVSSDQFHEYPPIVSRTNALKILNREGLLRAGGDAAAEETFLFSSLPDDEPRPKEQKVPSYQLLPKSRICPEGEAGMW